METISKMNTYFDEIEIIKVQEMSKYVDAYPVLDVYTKPGLTENSYVAYVCSTVKFSEMEQEMFGSLDPEITFMFIEHTMNSLIGNTVQLTDGREGRIVLVSKTAPTRPLIKVADEFIDLSKHSDLQIEQINS